MNHLNPSLPDKKRNLASEVKALPYYLEGILKKRDPFILAEAITLLESRQSEHRRMVYQILQNCPSKNTSRRIAVTGSPGVGKSTFVDQLGLHLREINKRVAVLSVDPTSSYTSGSILGDKARMMALAQYPDVFIRPSPSSLHLGGVHQYTYEAILLCEAAGYDEVIIETVGVGQSEIEIKDYADIVILLILPGSGDSLQGIKKGIMETADVIIIHKADGERLSLAQKMKKELEEAQHSQAHTQIPIIMHSSLKDNLDKVLATLDAQDDGNKSHEQNRKVPKKNFLLNRLQNLLIEENSSKLSELINQEISENQPESSIFEIYNSILEKYSFHIQFDKR